MNTRRCFSSVVAAALVGCQGSLVQRERVDGGTPDAMVVLGDAPSDPLDAGATRVDGSSPDAAVTPPPCGDGLVAAHRRVSLTRLAPFAYLGARPDGGLVAAHVSPLGVVIDALELERRS
jgi:hypothetical protein